MALLSTTVCEDGSKYCGECKDNVFHGLGILVKPGVGMFEGQWKCGQQVSGIFSWNNGKQYMGEWKDMCRCGLGVETRPNGTRYFGEFTQNVMGPLGVLSLPSQGLYLGAWKPNANFPGGEKDGEGVEAYGDGGFYRGQYKNGMRNGHGTRTSVSYEELHLDCLKKSSSNRASMASIVIGRTMMGKGSNKDVPNPTGTLKGQSSGTMQNQIYEGQWENDRRTGHGILKVVGFYTYYGEWKDNQRTGYGVLVRETSEKDGGDLEEARQEGFWKDGTLEEPVKHKRLGKSDMSMKVNHAHACAIEAARTARQKAQLAEDRADAAAAKCQAAKGKAAKAYDSAQKAMLKSHEVIKSATETVESVKEIKRRIEVMTGGNKDLAMLQSPPAGSATLPSSFNYKQLSIDMMPEVQGLKQEESARPQKKGLTSPHSTDFSSSKLSHLQRSMAFTVNADSD